MNAPFYRLAVEPGFRSELAASKQALRIAIYLGLLIVDCLAIAAAFLISDKLFMVRGAVPEIRGHDLALMTVPLYLAFAINRDVYSMSALTEPRTNALRTLSTLAYGLVAVLMVLFVIHQIGELSRLLFASATVLSGVFIVTGRLLMQGVAQRALNGKPTHELLIIDDVDFEHKAAYPDFIHTDQIGLKPDLNDPRMLHRLGVVLNGFDKAVIACSMARRDDWTLLLRGANILGEIVAPEFDMTGVMAVGKFENHNTYVVSRGPLSASNRAKKRLLDLALTVPVLLALAIPMLIIALLVKLDSPGPVLFRQYRVGRGNRQFQILKFRSMRVDLCDHNGSKSADREDARITRVGRVIRRLSLDELPQLLNVLRGDMSLVGPRPHALGSLAGDKLFWEVDRKYWMRHALKPGITGLAQVRGFRGPTERHDDLVNRLGSDLEYIENWSLAREVQILLRTALVVIHKNAF